jgi:thiol-disulfide isomerase/thioredoxin
MVNRYNLLLVIILVAPIIVSCKNEVSRSNSESQVTAAHDFKLTDLKEEKSFSLSEFKGKPVILNFWATWCTPCREEIPFLQKSWDTYKENGLILIGINVMDDAENARDFLNSFDIDYLNLLDKSGSVSGKYRVVALPATFFIDKNGNIYKQNYGPFLGDSGEKLFIKYIEEIL